jgi:hypothetical protein
MKGCKGAKTAYTDRPEHCPIGTAPTSCRRTRRKSRSLGRLVLVKHISANRNASGYAVRAATVRWKTNGGARIGRWGLEFPGLSRSVRLRRPHKWSHSGPNPVTPGRRQKESPARSMIRRGEVQGGFTSGRRRSPKTPLPATKDGKADGATVTRTNLRPGQRRHRIGAQHLWCAAAANHPQKAKAAMSAAQYG